MTPLVIALPKGRILKEALPLLAEVGVHPEPALFDEDSRALRFAIVGDVLFQGSVGRTDFPKGDFQQLVNSITTRLWPLGNQTAFVPGHGAISTFGRERQTNPFVGDAVL